ncbi:DUF2007 domain-containing protein [Paraglaciecola aquimarina]|uniref:DUF2007 domain-containing protein n=1 Tax=Paraglaciecola aquimarina TaxID=1235557 RepID=A0ABU3SWT8_9ALTE|nr:DUF2007 domain-containing protein [Paraglaciecola aquimarina]MDU0354478.1 DUF2007 domain-containing protein [Paraglaciecola aquimarina]
MKLVYRNENNILVNHAKNLLENAGIEVLLKNEYVSTGSHPHFVFLELWIVNDLDEDKALGELSSLQSNEASEEWLCPDCGESNDASFEICWNCKHERNAQGE